MFQIFNVSGSAVSAQSQRLNVVASNLANADTVAGPDGSAYKARQVVFQTALMGAATSRRRRRARVHGAARTRRRAAACTTPSTLSADAEGYVTYSNVNSGGGDGQHDLGLALLPEQRRSDEHGQACCRRPCRSASEDPAAQLTPMAHRQRRLVFAYRGAQHHGRLPAARRATANSRPAADHQDRFLKLLVAQMQNQDPLNPMDNAQVTSQMAQIHRQRHREAQHQPWKAWARSSPSCRQLSGAAWSAATSRMLSGNRLTAQRDGVGARRLRPRRAAPTRVKVEVLNAAGRVIDTVELGAETAGRHGFEWTPAQGRGGVRPRAAASASSPRSGSTAVTPPADARPRRWPSAPAAAACLQCCGTCASGQGIA
jgi:flagellar basal-body rod protein FlgC